MGTAQARPVVKQGQCVKALPRLSRRLLGERKRGVWPSYCTCSWKEISAQRRQYLELIFQEPLPLIYVYVYDLNTLVDCLRIKGALFNFGTALLLLHGQNAKLYFPIHGQDLF